MDVRNAAIAVAHSWRACGRKRHDWMLCWTSQLKTSQLSANERVWLHEYLSAKVIHAGKRLHLVALDLTVAPEGVLTQIAALASRIRQSAVAA